MKGTSLQHEEEVRSGQRFEFGKNWSNFLSGLTVVQIKLAESSLKNFLEVDRLDGKTFLDVGSGSGLFSLAARRLGARVRSFDFDPQSVACTRELRRRYFNDDPFWTVEQGSVLDKDFLASLGQFDVVYSWGVLHHTGNMWQALDNVKPLVPVGGQLFIAIYNDQGRITDEWARIKQRYNSLPWPLAFAYALQIIARTEAREFSRQYRNGTPRDWLKSWTEYHKLSMRGMSKWYDWIDWIGGHPYERASIEQIVDAYSADGFRLTKLFDCSSGYGCNEFVFRREAPAGTFIENPLSGGRSFARTFGRRVLGPFELRQDHWTGIAPQVPTRSRRSSGLLLVRDDQLVGAIHPDGDGRIAIAPADEPETQLKKSIFHVVAAEERPLEPPFVRTRGRMWQKEVPDLADVADTAAEPTRSPVFVFEDQRQLPYPHAKHDDIDEYGEGRFSHWGPSIYFSTSDGSDPNSNGRSYRLIMLPQPLPKERSMAQRFGHRLVGPFQRTDAGWTATTEGAALGDRGELFLVCDDSVVGEAHLDDSGTVVIAPEEAEASELEWAAFFLVRARRYEMPRPFVHQRGHMWEASVPGLGVGDRVGDESSTAFVFENNRQLRAPHSSHDSIEKSGAGRFSHWESQLFFSASDDTDPNENGRKYEVFVAQPTAGR